MGKVAKPKRHCSKCGAALNRRNASGLCISHYNSDPGVVNGKRAAISAARRRRLAADPEFAARQREHGRWLSRNYSSLANDSISPKTRARVGRKYTERCLGWCPPERRGEYRRLISNRGFTAAEAKDIILGSMTPFERQMQRVRAGAGLVEVRPIRAADPAHSYTGSGLAQAVYG